MSHFREVCRLCTATVRQCRCAGEKVVSYVVCKKCKDRHDLPGSGEPEAREPARRPLVSSVRVEPGPRHDRVLVWTRGGLAGELIVDAGDGSALARRLFRGDSGEVPRHSPGSLGGAVVMIAKEEA